jgi:hypothetical protein
MKDILFWTLLIVILVSILYVSQTCVSGFQNVPPLFLPSQPLPPQEQLISGDYKSYTPPSFTTLAPPPGGVASVASLPYSDPAEAKGPYKRIKELLESANGFVNNEAPKMVELSDPAIQLPLTTLHADISRLNDEKLVLERNPGIESTLSQNDLDGIEANLAYLQKKWRTIKDSGSGNVEGFADSSGNMVTATYDELKDLIVKIQTEITRLTVSASRDPTTQKRVDVFTNIKKALQDIVDDIDKGLLRAADIPISQDAYVEFLPVLGTNSPLPQLFGNNLPPSLMSLFPTYGSGDVSGADVFRYLFGTYADSIFKGLSWDVNMNYVSERKANMTTTAADNALANLLSNQGLATQVPFRGEFATLTGNVNGAPVAPSSSSSPTFDDCSTNPTTCVKGLDWEGRANAICSAIQKRGYNPGDFGCMDTKSTVSKNFSWRGYARMVCSRVATIYDTGAPEAVGCPPATWPGWRS